MEKPKGNIKMGLFNGINTARLIATQPFQIFIY